MKKRIKVREYKGWRSKSIDFRFEDSDLNYTCDEGDWRKYEIMFELTNQGAAEALLEELYSLGYSEGSLDAETED